MEEDPPRNPVGPALPPPAVRARAFRDEKQRPPPPLLPPLRPPGDLLGRERLPRLPPDGPGALRRRLPRLPRHDERRHLRRLPPVRADGRLARTPARPNPHRGRQGRRLARPRRGDPPPAARIRAR